MDLYNNFFYLAQFTIDESTSKLASPCRYSFYLYLIADTGLELERFHLQSVDSLKSHKVALYMKFKIRFDRESKAAESSVKLASVLYQEDFDNFIKSFESHSQYSENIICKGHTKNSANLYDVIRFIKQEVKNNLSNPLYLDKYPSNTYHSPHNSYKSIISRKIIYLEDTVESEVNMLTDKNLDKSYMQDLDENTPGDLAFTKYYFYLASPNGTLKNIKLKDKLELSLPTDKKTKLHKI